MFQKFFNNIQDGNEYKSFGLEEIKKVGGQLSDDGKTISLNHQQFVDMVYKSDQDIDSNYQKASVASVGWATCCPRV